MKGLLYFALGNISGILVVSWISHNRSLSSIPRSATSFSSSSSSCNCSSAINYGHPMSEIETEIPKRTVLARTNTSSRTPATILAPLDDYNGDELDRFLKKYPDSPGAKFHKLWSRYRGKPEEEMRRLESCNPIRENYGICLGGYLNYHRKVNESGGSIRPPLALIPVPLWDSDVNQTDVVNVERLRYVERNKVIPQLGTTASCIPLMLAGFAALSTNPYNGIVVEAGPFAGFSSRCIAAGMKYYGKEIERSFIALDTFEEMKNFKAISALAPWTVQENPDFSVNNTHFLWLWEKNVRSMYPPAIGRPGWINKESLNPQSLWNKTLTMLCIDSAKTPVHLTTQLEGLFPITAGTIVFLMDFGSAKYQPAQIYGCLRPYMIPLYAHQEQWAFIVQKDIISLSEGDIASCYQDLKDDKDGSVEKVVKQLKNDFKNSIGLDPDKIMSTELQQFGQLKLYEPFIEKVADRHAYRYLAGLTRPKNL